MLARQKDRCQGLRQQDSSIDIQSISPRCRIHFKPRSLVLFQRYSRNSHRIRTRGDL